MSKFISLIFLVTSITSVAQGKIISGSFKNLADIKSYNVTFDYDGIKVAHYAIEEEFLADKLSKREGEKAKDFRKRWFSDREAIYEPAFIDYFNKRMGGQGIKVGKNADAPYTIDIKTLWLYPGYNVGVGREEAKITAIITVFETSNPANIVLKVEYDKSPGIEPEENAFDPGNRIAGAYQKLAKNLTLQLKRFVK